MSRVNTSTHNFCQCGHLPVTSSMTSLVKKLELTYICNISSRRSNKTTKLGKGQVQVMGHLLVQTTCARASSHACTGASKNKNAPNDFLLTVLYVSGHLEHFSARAYARVFFARTPFPTEKRIFFDGFRCLTEFYIV